MSTLLYELDADSIYEQLILNSEDESDAEEDDYREDKMDQMISRHG